MSGLTMDYYDLSESQRLAIVRAEAAILAAAPSPSLDSPSFLGGVAAIPSSTPTAASEQVQTLPTARAGRVDSTMEAA